MEIWNMKHWLLPAVLAGLVIPTAAQAMYDPIKLADKQFKQMDKNGDGRVSEKEYFRPANHRFKKFDTNKNGKIERQEMYDFWKNKRKIKTDNINAWEGPTNAHYKKHDKNKDDIITLDEYLSASQKRFDALDLNEDKVVTLEELQEHWIERKKEVESHDFNESDDD